MNFFLPFLAAVLQAASATLDKVILSLPHVTYRTYVGASFPLFFLALVVIAVVVQPPFSLSLFAGNLLWLFLASTLIVLMTNLLYYRALDRDKLSELLLIDLVYYVPAVLYAALVFSDERNTLLLVLALFVSAVLIWSHWERHHFRMRKVTMPLLVWMVTIAPLNELIAKQLLTVWHPVMLLLVGNAVMVALTFPLLYRRLRRIEPRVLTLFILINVLSALAWSLYLYSYQRLGIVHTVLIFSLQPLLVYLASLVFLKETFHRKKFIAFAVILVSLVVAQVFA